MFWSNESFVDFLHRNLENETFLSHSHYNFRLIFNFSAFSKIWKKNSMLPVLFWKLGSQSGQWNVILLQTGSSKDNSSFNFLITVFSVSIQANEPITLPISTWTASPQERNPGRTSEIKWNENEPREHNKRGSCFMAANFESVLASFCWKKGQKKTRLQVTNESPQTGAEIALMCINGYLYFCWRNAFF